jgi:hypothetical protein
LSRGCARTSAWSKASSEKGNWKRLLMAIDLALPTEMNFDLAKENKCGNA